MIVLSLSLVLAAAPLKTAVVQLEAVEGVTPQTAAALTNVVVGELRKRPELAVLTPDEVGAMLGLERQKSLFGCEAGNSCMAELGGALGADRLVMGSVSKLGESFLVQLKLIDSQKSKPLAQSDRRVKGKGVDAVLDELPLMVNELFGGKAAGAAAASIAAAAPPAGTPSLTGPNIVIDDAGAEEPFEGEAKGLVYLSDGKGHVIAVTPFAGTSAPLFAGDEKRLFAQRLIGGGSSGKERFDLTFWDPRFASGWQKSFGFRDGKYALQCGDKKIEFKELPKKDAERVAKSAKLHEVRWRRAARAIAVSDSGDYYFADEPRDGAQNPRAIRLFFGGKGAMRQALVKDAVVKPDGTTFFLQSGEKVKLGGEKSELVSGGQAFPLETLDLFDQARMIYTELGVYSEPLGTPCDPFVAP